MIFGLNLPPPVGPANVEDAMNWVASVLFPSTWLDEPCHIPGSRKTNRERIVQDLLKRREMGRAQEAAGAFGQMAAALYVAFGPTFSPVHASSLTLFFVAFMTEHTRSPQSSVKG